MTEQQRPPGDETTPTEPTQPAPGPAPSAEPPPPPTETPGWSGASTPPSGATTASGLVYADVPNRAIAYIIDVVVLFIINLIAGIVLFAIFGAPSAVDFSASGVSTTINWAATIVYALVATAISAAYFIYTWTSMRGTVGQKLLSMQVGNAADGRTLTMDQAIRRWVFLGGPIGLIQALNPVPGIGLILALAGLAYFIYLLWSTAQSPTKQSFHDVQANTVVVKAARSVG